MADVEFRIVIIGKNPQAKTKLSDLITSQKTFKNTDESLIARGVWRKTSVKVVRCPDVLSLSVVRIKQEVNKCFAQHPSGPNVLLLIVNPSDFTEDDRQRLVFILNFFNSLKHALVIVTHTSDGQNPFVNKLIQDCGQRQHRMNLKETQVLGCDVEGLMEKMDHMVRENNGQCVNILKRAEPKKRQERGATKPRLNLVLCGRFVLGKKSTAQAILGKVDSKPSEGSKHEAEVCGWRVTLTELPSMCGKPQNILRQDMMMCISLFDPEGVHGFIHVLPLDPPTDQDKEDLMTLQNISTSRVNDFSMIAFTVECDPKNRDVVNFVKTNQQIQELCQNFGGRYVVINIKNREQIPQLLETVDKIKATQSGGFTKEMITKPRKLGLSQCVRSYTTQNTKSTDPLRMVLIGKTGCGKSATANTILGKDCFYSSISSTSVTKCCNKEKGEVDRRPVTVVDTPGLFDTSLSNDEVKQELLKCISMLAPGPHVLLLVIQIGRMTQEQEDTFQLIKECFGYNSADFVIIIFTRGDELENQSIESYIKSESNGVLKKLTDECGGRYHVLNNKDKSNRTQVSQLMDKVERLVHNNSGGHYTSKIFQEAQAAIDKEMERNMKVKEEEMQRKLKESESIYLKKLEEFKKEVENNQREREKSLLEKQLILQMEEAKKFQEKRDEEERKQEEEVQRQRKQEFKRTQSEKRNAKFTNENLQIPKATVKSLKHLWESQDSEFQRREQEEKLERERKLELKRTQSVKDFNGKRDLKLTKDDTQIFKGMTTTLRHSWEGPVRIYQQIPEEERLNLKMLREEFEQCKNAHEAQKIKEDQMTREQEERQLRKLQQDVQRTEEYMNFTGKEEARQQAEDINEFKLRYTEDFEALKDKHEQEIEGLKEQQELIIKQINTKPANKKQYDALMRKQKQEMDGLRVCLPSQKQIEMMQKNHEEQLQTWIREKIKNSPNRCRVL